MACQNMVNLLLGCIDSKKETVLSNDFQEFSCLFTLEFY